MKEKKFSKAAAVRFGWETVTKNLKFFIAVTLTAGVLYGLSNYLSDLLEKERTLSSAGVILILYVTSFVICRIVDLGLIKIALKFTDNVRAEVKDLFSCARMFFRYIAGTLLYALIVFLGLILLVVPGIIWMIKFQFYSYLIVDKGMGPVQALKESGRITQGAKGELILFALLVMGINFLGALALLVGLLITLPLTLLAAAFVYRKLLLASNI